MKFASLFRPYLILFACTAMLATALRAAESTPLSEGKTTLPRLIDLGAGKCIPCKMMKPILDDLKKNYADQFEVVFIDVWEKREEGDRYGISIIPTQIFYDSAGKEQFRHEGFMAKKDILAKWKELGVVVKEPSTPKDK